MKRFSLILMTLGLAMLLALVTSCASHTGPATYGAHYASCAAAVAPHQARAICR